MFEGGSTGSVNSFRRWLKGVGRGYLLGLLFFAIFILLLTTSVPSVLRIYYQQQRRSMKTTTTTRLPNSDDIHHCDLDCHRFQGYIGNFPSWKPKAAIYILVRRERLDSLRTCLSGLDAYFNDVYRYPVIIFHEEEMDNEVDRRSIRRYTNSKVYFQTVNFTIPKHVNPYFVTPRDCRGSPIGYRHMWPLSRDWRLRPANHGDSRTGVRLAIGRRFGNSQRNRI